MMTTSLPLLFRLRSSTVLIALSVILVIFTETFLHGLLVPIFAGLPEPRGPAPGDHAQTFASPLVGLVSAGTLAGPLVFGWIADHISHRRLALLACLALFTGGAAALWTGRHLATHLAGRFTLAFASSAIWTIGLALLVDTVATEYVGLAMGYASLAAASGYVAGTVFSGPFPIIALYGDTVLMLTIGLLSFNFVLWLLIIEKRGAAIILAAYQAGDEEERRPLLSGRRAVTVPIVSSVSGLVPKVGDSLPATPSVSGLVPQRVGDVIPTIPTVSELIPSRVGDVIPTIPTASTLLPNSLVVAVPNLPGASRVLPGAVHKTILTVPGSSVLLPQSEVDVSQTELNTSLPQDASNQVIPTASDASTTSPNASNAVVPAGVAASTTPREASGIATSTTFGASKLIPKAVRDTIPTLPTTSGLVPKRVVESIPKVPKISGFVPKKVSNAMSGIPSPSGLLPKRAGATTPIIPDTTGTTKTTSHSAANTPNAPEVLPTTVVDVTPTVTSVIGFPATLTQTIPSIPSTSTLIPTRVYNAIPSTLPTASAIPATLNQAIPSIPSASTLVPTRVGNAIAAIPNPTAFPGTLSQAIPNIPDAASGLQKRVNSAIPTIPTLPSRPTIGGGIGGVMPSFRRFSSFYPRRKSDYAFFTLLISKRFVLGLVCAFGLALLQASLEATLPVRLHELFGYGPREARLDSLSLIAPSILAPFFGYLCHTSGNRAVAFFGFIICGTATILLRIPTQNNTESKVGLIIDLSVVGISFYMIITPLLAEVFSIVKDLQKKPDRFGSYGAFARAFGLFNIVYAIGLWTQPKIVGNLTEKYTWNDMTLTLGILCFVGSFLVIPVRQFVKFYIKTVAKIIFYCVVSRRLRRMRR